MRLELLIAATTLALGAADASSQTVPIWPGAAPGSELWKQKEQTIEHTPVGTIVVNVVTPTLTAYLPARSRATGTAVVVTPGGGFVALAISQGGTDVAAWLQERGVAAFVLKYRIPENHHRGIPAMDMDTAGRYGVTDALQAIRLLRRHAARWGIAPDRIGMLGFSAGAMVASQTMIQGDREARPDFVGLLYGAPFGRMPAIPRSLPPVFLAWAQDDGIATSFVPRFLDALRSAGHQPAVHVYATGGHGFSIRRQGTPSDQWTEDFWAWLGSRGLTHRAPTVRR